MKISNYGIAAAIWAAAASGLVYAASPTTPEANDSQTTRDIKATAGDAAITAKVKAALLKDPQVAGLKINVDTRAGVVTLNGKVASPAEAQKAVIVASGVEHVTDVVNRLEVAAR